MSSKGMQYHEDPVFLQKIALSHSTAFEYLKRFKAFVTFNTEHM